MKVMIPCGREELRAALRCAALTAAPLIVGGENGEVFEETIASTDM